MLRNILIFFGSVVAILPYVGIPYDVTKWIWTVLGLFIVFLLFFSQKGKLHYIPYSLEDDENSMRELPVRHQKDESVPHMHIEKDGYGETQIDSVISEGIRVEETVVTTIRKRRKKIGEFFTHLASQEDERG
jgi:hypothetical protein